MTAFVLVDDSGWCIVLMYPVAVKTKWSAGPSAGVVSGFDVTLNSGSNVHC